MSPVLRRTVILVTLACCASVACSSPVLAESAGSKGQAKKKNVAASQSSSNGQVIARTGAHANEGYPVYNVPQSQAAYTATQTCTATQTARTYARPAGGGYYKALRVALPTPEEYRVPWSTPRKAPPKKVAAKPQAFVPTMTYQNVPYNR